MAEDGTKMSKSKGNVINPDDYIERYGTDVFRVYLMFMGDYLEGGDFRNEGLRAMGGFLDRVWNVLQAVDLEKGEISDPETLYWLHRTIKAVSADIKRFSYNTALARIMELLNHISKAGVRNQTIYETFLILLSPFAPHICEDLWHRLGHTKSIFNQRWPDYDEAHTIPKEIEFVVQVNGKVRSKKKVQIGLVEADIEKLVMTDAKTKQWIEGKRVIKKIFVPDKLMNLVVR